jgi:hypothetical protein
MAYELFISYASEDKEALVRPLADWFSHQGVKVWYDDYVLMPGDSIREKINEGLRVCPYGLVVLSPRFYAKSWPQRELNSLFSLMTNATDRRLIPVVLDMSFKDLGSRDPLLADIKGLSAEVGVEAVGRAVIQTMIRDEADLRHLGVTRYKHSYYSHNYYRPPEDIAMFGYRFEQPYEFEILEDALRPREVLMALLPSDGTKEFTAACHITCRERLRDLQRDCPTLAVFAADIDKLRGEFDEPFSTAQLYAIRRGI